MIQIAGLTKSYGEKQVLTGINATFLEGHVYGIVGENGAGKTTLFRCIAGLEDYKGEIKSELFPLKNHLGFLLSETYVFSKITGLEYIRLLCNARQKNAIDIEKRNIFDLPLNQYASTYSTGMKKKLAITAILLQDNHYFIFDEPFNGVDIQSNIIIVEIIHKLRELKKIVESSPLNSWTQFMIKPYKLLSHGKASKELEFRGKSQDCQVLPRVRRSQNK